MGFLNLSEQLARVRARQERTRRLMIWMLEDDEQWRAICDLSDARLIATYPEFGDRMFHTGPVQNLKDLREELADGRNYGGEVVGEG